MVPVDSIRDSPVRKVSYWCQFSCNQRCQLAQSSQHLTRTLRLVGRPETTPVACLRARHQCPTPKPAHSRGRHVSETR